MKTVTLEDVLKLRSEIVLNSLFISDYQNSIGLDPREVCIFFDGYVDFLAEKIEFDFGKLDGDDYFDALWEYDTPENLEEWWGCFAVNPFTTGGESNEDTT